MKLHDLIAQPEIISVEGDVAAEIRSLAYDSRKVQPGGAFFALRGLAADGLEFAGDAYAKGAVVCIADRPLPRQLPDGRTFVRVADPRASMAVAADLFHGRPSRRLDVVGITGTNGKTTTTFMLDAVFREAGRTSGMFGTIEYRAGDRAFVASRTTPESTDLQAMLADCVAAGCSHAAMEVSSHALEMKRVHAMRFAAAVFTNLTQDHLDFHRDMQQYLRAKLKLFESLESVAAAVINRDVPEHVDVARATQARVVSFGMSAGADVTIDELRLSADGFRGTLKSPWGTAALSSPLAGRFNVSNALGALTAACTIGIPLDAAVRGIAKMAAVPGRVERIDLGAFSAVIDYAHSPDALENLLSSLKPLARGRLIAVFGCGGDRDRGKRPKMAAAVARHADWAVLTSDNPRTEDPVAIMDQAEAGFSGFTSYDTILDRREAIARALDSAAAGDIVVIAGKGHEDYQILGTRVIHFSDREVVEEWKNSVGQGRA